MRPGGLKTSSTRSDVSASSKATTPNLAPPSPRKQLTLRSTTQSSSMRPPSPKKTDMPPPSRPGRSASLRQPAGAGAAPTQAPRGHARHRSQQVPTSTKAVQSDATPGSQRARPQFASYQQHYSPKKPNKPPTPTLHDTPAPGTLLVPASWPDVAALQTELLQLSLFHSSCLQRQTEWRTETEARLREKYDAVAGQYHVLVGDEQSRQRMVNAQALTGWLQNCDPHGGSHGFPEQLQVLSQILQEISDLTTDGTDGRYTCAVATFDRWLQHADHVRCARESSRALHEIPFLDPLEPAWKEELNALQAKLELCTRYLHSLDTLGIGEVDRLAESALLRITRGLRQSMQLMGQEIQAMRTLEAELVQCERETVRDLVTQVTSDHRAPRETRGVWNEA
ncbi:hypothetical protein N7492_002340 [Penicillium capsulatum]|uniref:Uncharacterized protein n=1 Tax=Penicillium capsulatum TaxID=69766 RepID=A0A9W9ILC0_9EURO|nr:hypothetical protein N7492_002340 [Penicillium capsulatum]KAJ6123054.1 hypothetical protein N7512_005519 [Penicillium capsulatum]